MKKWEVINQQTLLANQRLIYRWRKIFKCSVLLLGLGTSTCKPETQGETRNFLLPEPDPNPRNDTRTQPEPKFCYVPEPITSCYLLMQQTAAVLASSISAITPHIKLKVLGRSRFFDCFFFLDCLSFFMYVSITS